jgi:hypothetical protein
MERAVLSERAATSSRIDRDERVLQGPLPLAWLLIAAKLPGRSLHLAIVLWYAAGLSGSSSIHIGNTLCLRFGLDRNAKYRALRSLELAGVITVKRKRGRSPLVTILQCDGTR